MTCHLLSTFGLKKRLVSFLQSKGTFDIVLFYTHFSLLGTSIIISVGSAISVKQWQEYFFNIFYLQ